MINDSVGRLIIFDSVRIGYSSLVDFLDSTHQMIGFFWKKIEIIEISKN